MVPRQSSAIHSVMLNDELLSEIASRCSIRSLCNLALVSKSIYEPIVRKELALTTCSLPHLLKYLPDGLFEPYATQLPLRSREDFTTFFSELNDVANTTSSSDQTLPELETILARVKAASIFSRPPTRDELIPFLQRSQAIETIETIRTWSSSSSNTNDAADGKDVGEFWFAARVCLHLIAHFPEVQFFPGLKAMSITPERLGILYTIPPLVPAVFFAHSKSIELHADFATIQVFVKALLICTKPSSIQGLRLIPHDPHPTGTHENALVPNLVQSNYSSLRKIQMPWSLDLLIWCELANSSNICEINLGQDGFRGSQLHRYPRGSNLIRPPRNQQLHTHSLQILGTMRMSGAALRNGMVVEVLETINFPNLHTVSFDFPVELEAVNGIHDLAQPTDILRSLCKGSLQLRHLHLDYSKLSKLEGRGLRNGEHISISLLEDTLGPLTMLEYIHIDLGYVAHLHLEENARAYLPTAWPRLRHLHLVSPFYPRQRPASDGSDINYSSFTHIRIADLVEFALQAPLLEYICLPLSDAEQDAIIDTAPLQKRVSLLPSPPTLSTLPLSTTLALVENPQAVADFLGVIYPSLRRVVLPDWEKYQMWQERKAEATWVAVQGYLDDR